MKITYYHTLYKREVTEIVFGDITFKDGRVCFWSHGRAYGIEFEYVRKIEPLGDLI